MGDKATAQTSQSLSNLSPTVVPQNTSLKDGCVTVVLSEMEFLPGDNPDTIVSAEAEALTRRVKDTALVFLFLIGGPGNVINMSVFYKQGLRDRVNLCLFALSLADELYLIAAMLHHAEQVHLQFTTKERFGPLMTFFTNNHFTGLLGFAWVSFVLSAIIASERCLCVLRPLKFHTLMRARTMAGIITAVYLLVLGLFFIVAFRYRIGCVHDPVSGITLMIPIVGKFYSTHKELVDHVDSIVFGAGVPVVAMVVVITTTTITTLKLRQIVTWRAETTTSVSAREVALTKMLIGTSILFIFCVSPIALIRFSWFFFPEMNHEGRNQNFFQTSVWIVEICTYINSTFNICVYFVMGSRYRQTFWAFFCRKSKLEKT